MPQWSPLASSCARKQRPRQSNPRCCTRQIWCLRRCSCKEACGRSRDSNRAAVALVHALASGPRDLLRAQVGGAAAIEQLELELESLRGDSPQEAPGGTSGAVSGSAPAAVSPEAAPQPQPRPATDAPVANPGPSPPAAGAAPDAGAPRSPPAAPRPLKEAEAQTLKEAYAKAKLAHEAVCDFAPAAEPSGMDQLRGIAERAFWDVLEAEVSTDPPEYARVGALVDEVRVEAVRAQRMRAEVHLCARVGVFAFLVDGSCDSNARAKSRARRNSARANSVTCGWEPSRTLFNQRMTWYEV